MKYKKLLFTLILYMNFVPMIAVIGGEKFKKIELTLNECRFILSIPKGYKQIKLSSIENVEYIFCYSDSSCIYISDFFYNSNTNNIKSLGDSIYNLRFQNISLVKEINNKIGMKVIPLRPDTVDLRGVLSNQLAWRDIAMGSISIGYYHVPVSKTDMFDNILSFIRIIHLNYVSNRDGRKIMKK